MWSWRVFLLQIFFFHLLQVRLDSLITALLKANTIRLLKTLIMFESTCSFHTTHTMYSASSAVTVCVSKLAVFDSGLRVGEHTYVAWRLHAWRHCHRRRHTHCRGLMSCLYSNADGTRIISTLTALYLSVFMMFVCLIWRCLWLSEQQMTLIHSASLPPSCTGIKTELRDFWPLHRNQWLFSNTNIYTFLNQDAFT